MPRSWPTRSTIERGYGAEHQMTRKRYMENLQPGDPCARCGRPMYPGQHLDLDHDDTRQHYIGLSHRHCNRSAGGKIGNHRRFGTPRKVGISRDW